MDRDELNEKLKEQLEAGYTKNRAMIDKAIMPISKKAKKDLDEWANDNINMPMAKRGHINTGAALSAAISTAGELLIPENLAEAAMAVSPNVKIMKAANGMVKLLPIEAKAATKKYGSISDDMEIYKGPAEKVAATAKALKETEADRLAQVKKVNDELSDAQGTVIYSGKDVRRELKNAKMPEPKTKVKSKKDTEEEYLEIADDDF